VRLSLRLAAIITGCCVSVGLFVANPGSARAAAATDPPMGLMVQVSSLSPATSPATLKGWLEDVRRDHHDSAKPAYVNTIVLQDIADGAGALYTRYLDVLAPYLPGGATPIFTRAYVGTVDLAWKGNGSKYIQGIESSTFRAENVKISLAAAKAFYARYPRVAVNWYVTYEANLAGFWDANLAGAYRTYLVQIMNALSSVRANRAFLWSPAFWTMYADEPTWAAPGLKANLSKLFSNLPTPLTLSVQDFVGQSGGASTPQSAAAWVAYLKRNWSSHLAKVQINVEQFTQSASGSIAAGSAAELPRRESYYRSQGIELGAAWEIRYWHARLYGC
jgi:hypothetical protein